MLSLLPALLLGFLLGMRHATDADHVMAVTTIAADQRSLRRASAIGALWGLGHSVTILLVGGAIVAFRVAIPPRLGLAMEFAVAVMLVTLGALTLHGRPIPIRVTAGRPIAVGLVHGLAGSAFVAMLALAAIPGIAAGLAYLALFGLGTIAGMAVITLLIAVPAALVAPRFGSAQRYLRLASGVASIGFGLFLAHQVGIVDGLFTASPVWAPQ